MKISDWLYLFFNPDDSNKEWQECTLPELIKGIFNSQKTRKLNILLDDLDSKKTLGDIVIDMAEIDGDWVKPKPYQERIATMLVGLNDKEPKIDKERQAEDSIVQQFSSQELYRGRTLTTQSITEASNLDIDKLKEAYICLVKPFEKMKSEEEKLGYFLALKWCLTHEVNMPLDSIKEASQTIKRGLNYPCHITIEGEVIGGTVIPRKEVSFGPPLNRPSYNDAYSWFNKFYEDFKLENYRFRA